MTNDEIEARVLTLIAEAIPKKRSAPTLTLGLSLKKDLGFDSILLASMIFKLEEAFGIDLAQIEIPPQATRVKTVGEAIEVSREIVLMARAAAPAPAGAP